MSDTRRTGPEGMVRIEHATLKYFFDNHSRFVCLRAAVERMPSEVQEAIKREFDTLYNAEPASGEELLTPEEVKLMRADISPDGPEPVERHWDVRRIVATLEHWQAKGEDLIPQPEASTGPVLWRCSRCGKDCEDERDGACTGEPDGAQRGPYRCFESINGRRCTGLILPIQT